MVICPICQNEVVLEKVTIREDIFRWLIELGENGILESWMLSSKIIHDQVVKGTTTQIVAENVRLFEDRIMNMTREELTKFSVSLNQISVGLAERLFKPAEKGEYAELGTLDDLEQVCSEDSIKRLGGKGEPDLVAKPRYKGSEIGETVIFEIKDTGRWSRQYIEQLEKWMTEYNTPFGILATHDLPADAKAKGFSVSCDQGVILVTQLEYAALSYQILRKILIALYLEGKEVVDFRALFKDEEIMTLLTEAKGYTKYVNNIRRHARDIEKELEEMQNQLDSHLDTLLHRIAAFQAT